MRNEVGEGIPQADGREVNAHQFLALFSQWKAVVPLNLCVPLATVHISFSSASADRSGCFPNQSNAAGEEDIFLSASNLHACVCMCAPKAEEKLNSRPNGSFSSEACCLDNTLVRL